MNRVIVIGAGASGMVAAIMAARGGATVTVLEKNNKVGKKLLATGNGRCNITNTTMSFNNYRSENIDFVKNIIEKYDTDAIKDFFESISVKTREINGYVYPYSLQASTIVDKLVNECNRLGIKVLTDVDCNDVKFGKDDSVHVYADNKVYVADKLIVATGLVASVGIKGDKVNIQDVFALKIAKKLGHHIFDVTPGLTGLKCDNAYLSKVSGVRWEAKVSTYVEGSLLYEDVGEVQFADYGISGIVVFQNARFTSKMLKNDKKIEVIVDFMPEMCQNTVKSMLDEQFSKFQNSTVYDILSGIFNNKLVTYILLNSNINGSIKANVFKDMKKLINTIKNHKMSVVGTRGFEYAQVCAGGIDTREIKETMESKKADNIYFTGELLDVDGMCGGYNLHFAFATGIEAGINAGNGAKNDKN